MSERDRYPSEAADRFQVRMTTGLRDRIRAAAEANNRSMNSEIIATLEEKYPAPKYATVEELEDAIRHVRDLLERGPLEGREAKAAELAALMVERWFERHPDDEDATKSEQSTANPKSTKEPD